MKQTASVRYKLQVIDKHGKVIEDRAPKNNLILDQGLGYVTSYTWAEQTNYALVGTGTTPVKRDSGAITFSRSGTTVTASAAFFESDDVGRLLKFDSGEEMYVSTFTSDTEVEVDTSGALSSSEGTVWYVNETGLETYVKNSNTYGIDTGDNGTSYTAPNLTFKRTFTFSIETEEVTYTEIGWTRTSSNSAVFGRDLIPGGVTVPADGRLKVVVELILELSPVTPTVVTTPANNGNDASFDASGSASIEMLSMDPDSTGSTEQYSGALQMVMDDGELQVFHVYPPLEPSEASTLTLSSENFTLVDAFLGGSNFTTGSHIDVVMANDSYVDKSYEIIKRVTFGTGTGYTGITGLCFGQAFARRNFSLKFDTPQSKSADHTLEVVLKVSWGRKLVN